MAHERGVGAQRLPIWVAVGSPQEVVEKILFQHELFRHDRFLIKSGPV